MNKAKLEEILEEYSIESGPNNDLVLLKAYMQKYPAFSDALMDFAASRSVLRQSPDPEIKAEREFAYLKIGREVMKRFRESKKKTTPDSIRSLTEAGKKIGFNKQQLALSLGISISLLMYLERKKLRFETIPKTLVSRLAEALRTTDAAISTYLNLGPTVAANTSYKSKVRPVTREQKSFGQAVKEDQTLSNDEKNILLEMID